MSEIIYAKVGGPPDDWHGLRVFDLDTGEEVADVTEVDVAAGWVERYKCNAEGEFFLDETGRRAASERLCGRFEIRRPS